MTVDIRPKKHSINDLIELGMLSSVASISFVNRFKIRPIGVDSKNLKFPFNTEDKSFSCNDLDALMYIPTKNTFATKLINAKKIFFFLNLKYVF